MSTRHATVVTIDGPAGSGKSTIAAILAARLGVTHIDTGADYRATTLAVLRDQIDPHDADGCTALAGAAPVEHCGGRTLLDGVDVTEAIRGDAVTAAVSAVSSHPGVRTALRGRQRVRALSAGAVVEGRDAGTAVVPDAAVKVWLTATPAARARRRALQDGRSDADTVAAYVADLERRDRADAARMVPAPDAVFVDTTDRTVEELVDEIAALVDERTRIAAGPDAP